MAYTTIKKPSDYFNTKIYTGNSSTLSVTGVGFQPDWTWIKDRNSAGDDHALYDAVRGATKRIRSNQTDAENTQSDGLTSFDSDGFTVGTNGASNGDGQPFVAWNWLASNTASSNTDGSITSTVSANTTSGFSIVSYTGTGSVATIGHGLSSTPKIVLIKNRDDGTTDWLYYTTQIDGSLDSLRLNGGNAKSDSSFSLPTSSVFSINGSSSTGFSGQNYIAYCFAEKKGFSKFGTYIGNGNADGTFVYTGFKPAFIMLKCSTNSAPGWMMFDNKRLGYNPDNNVLYPNGADAEGTNDDIDLLSNGFKARSTDIGLNQSGGTYVYMAFAEEPLVGDNPATAR